MKRLLLAFPLLVAPLGLVATQAPPARAARFMELLEPPIVVPDEADIRRTPRPATREAGPVDWSPTEEEQEAMRSAHATQGGPAGTTFSPPAPPTVPSPDAGASGTAPARGASPAPSGAPSSAAPAGRPAPAGSPGAAGASPDAPANTSPLGAPTLDAPRLDDSARRSFPSPPVVPVVPAPPVNVPGPGGI